MDQATCVEVMQWEKLVGVDWRAKLAKSHVFLKFLAKNQCFENKWGSTTFLEIEF